MSKVIYDEEKGSLQIIPQQEQKRALRGFVLTVANSEADAQAVAAGDHSKMQLAPVLANVEQEAIDLVGAKGKFVMGIISYEYLVFQKELIEKLSENDNIELLSLDLFRTNQV